MNNIFKILLFLCCLVHLINAQQNCNGPPPHIKKHEECCTTPKLFSENAMQSCFQHSDHHAGQVAAPPGTPNPTPTAAPSGSNHHFHGSCGIECLFNNSGSYSGNGVVNQANLLSTFTQSFTGQPSEITTDLTNAVNSCFTLATTNAATFASMYAADPSHCDPVTAYIMICVERALLAGCPADKFNSDQECAALKAYVTACPGGPL